MKNQITVGVTYNSARGPVKVLCINQTGNVLVTTGVEQFYVPPDYLQQEIEPMDHVKMLEEKVKQQHQALTKLSQYFTSGNAVTIDKATIAAKDFWSITGLDSSNRVKPS